MLIIAKKISISSFPYWLGLLLAAIWLFTGCEIEPFSADKGYKCNSDTDCLTDFQCQGSKCVRKPSTGPENTTSETTQDAGENTGESGNTDATAVDDTKEPTPEPTPEPIPEPVGDASLEMTPEPPYEKFSDT